MQAEHRTLLHDDHDAPVRKVIQKSQDYLLSVQYPEGYWWGELESNPTMEAEYLLLTYFLEKVDRERWRKLCNFILSKQQSDGSWGQYYQAPGDVSTSVECYFALKLAGIDPERQEMRLAREFILSKGGVPRTRVFTKIWLALFGQWDWKGTPVIPPEVMLLPNVSPLNIYEFSSWARATIVPMLIILTQRPTKQVPSWACIDELYPVPRSQVAYTLPSPSGFLGWAKIFHWMNGPARLYETIPLKPGRSLATNRAVEWIISHQEDDGAWGGIQPPWAYSLIALKHSGYSMDHPVMQKGFEGFEGFVIEDKDTCRVQACISPVWDTGLVQSALQNSGLGQDHPALQRSTNWLLGKQIRAGGDWQVKNKRTEPGGWAFEFHNNIYPDVDDAAEVIIALNDARLAKDQDRARLDGVERGIRWVLSMQSKNGGWAAFDKDNTNRLLAKIPFSDFGEALDPPSVDVAAHVVEMLGRAGYARDMPAIKRAYKYIKNEQEPDGPWFGRWGVNYIYGTGAVIPALEAIGEDMEQPYIRLAVSWLLDHQNSDGGWGESCGSYVDHSLAGVGPSSASQTAWALMALISAGEWAHSSTRAGVEYLARAQKEDGSWDEPYYTGTGFPGYGIGQKPGKLPAMGQRGYQGLEMPAGFMINYHMYRNCWPLTALGRYRHMMERDLEGQRRVRLEA